MSNYITGIDQYAATESFEFNGHKIAKGDDIFVVSQKFPTNGTSPGYSNSVIVDKGHNWIGDCYDNFKDDVLRFLTHISKLSILHIK